MCLAKNEQFLWPAKLKQDFYGLLLGRPDAPEAILVRYINNSLWSRVLDIGRAFSRLKPVEIAELRHFDVHGIQSLDEPRVWLERDTQAAESPNAVGIIFINYLSLEAAHRARDLIGTRARRSWRLLVSVPPHESIADWIDCLSTTGVARFSNWEVDLPQSNYSNPSLSGEASALQSAAFEHGLVLLDDAADFLAQRIHMATGSMKDNAQAAIFRIQLYIGADDVPLTKAAISFLFRKPLSGLEGEMAAHLEDLKRSAYTSR